MTDNPLAPNPITDIDGPDVFRPKEPEKDQGEEAPTEAEPEGESFLDRHKAAEDRLLKSRD